MSTSNNRSNSVDAALADTCASVPALVDKTAAAVTIAQDEKVGFPDDNGVATGAEIRWWIS